MDVKFVSVLICCVMWPFSPTSGHTVIKSLEYSIEQTTHTLITTWQVLDTEAGVTCNTLGVQMFEVALSGRLKKLIKGITKPDCIETGSEIVFSTDLTTYKVQPFRSYKLCLHLHKKHFNPQQCSPLFALETFIPYNPVTARIVLTSRGDVTNTSPTSKRTTSRTTPTTATTITTTTTTPVVKESTSSGMYLELARKTTANFGRTEPETEVSNYKYYDDIFKMHVEQADNLKNEKKYEKAIEQIESKHEESDEQTRDSENKVKANNLMDKIHAVNSEKVITATKDMVYDSSNAKQKDDTNKNYTVKKFHKGIFPTVNSSQRSDKDVERSYDEKASDVFRSDNAGHSGETGDSSESSDIKTMPMKSKSGIEKYVTEQSEAFMDYTDYLGDMEAMTKSATNSQPSIAPVINMIITSVLFLHRYF